MTTGFSVTGLLSPLKVNELKNTVSDFGAWYANLTILSVFVKIMGFHILRSQSSRVHIFQCILFGCSTLFAPWIVCSSPICVSNYLHFPLFVAAAFTTSCRVYAWLILVFGCCVFLKETTGRSGIWSLTSGSHKIKELFLSWNYCSQKNQRTSSRTYQLNYQFFQFQNPGTGVPSLWKFLKTWNWGSLFWKFSKDLEPKVITKSNNNPTLANASSWTLLWFMVTT